MRIGLVILFTLVFSVCGRAQSDYLKFRTFQPYTWMVGAGWNFVDNDGRSHSHILDIKTSWIANYYPSYISVDRYLKKGFSVELSGGFNQFTERKMVNEAYHAGHIYSADLHAKFSFYKFLQPMKWLDPYVGLGIGLTQVATVNTEMYPTANGIVGVNFWIKNFGIRSQGAAKFGLTSDIYNNDKNYIQYSAALLYRFPKRYATKSHYSKPRHKWTKDKSRKYSGRSK